MSLPMATGTPVWMFRIRSASEGESEAPFDDKELEIMSLDGLEKLSNVLSGTAEHSKNYEVG